MVLQCGSVSNNIISSPRLLWCRRRVRTKRVCAWLRVQRRQFNHVKYCMCLAQVWWQAWHVNYRLKKDLSHVIRAESRSWNLSHTSEGKCSSCRAFVWSRSYERGRVLLTLFQHAPNFYGYCFGGLGIWREVVGLDPEIYPDWAFTSHKRGQSQEAGPLFFLAASDSPGACDWVLLVSSFPPSFPLKVLAFQPF